MHRSARPSRLRYAVLAKKDYVEKIKYQVGHQNNSDPGHLLVKSAHALAIGRIDLDEQTMYDKNSEQQIKDSEQPSKTPNSKLN